MRRMGLVLLAGLLLVACVPTPEVTPIINQFSNSNTTQQMESVEEIPPRWQETIEQNNVTLCFDADVTAPKSLSIQERAFAPHLFAQTEVDDIVTYFAHGRALYVFPSSLSKADYEQMYLDALKGMEIDGEYVMTEENETYIKELQEKILSASDDGGKKYTDSTLTFDINQNRRDVTAGGQNFLSVAIDSGKHEDATLRIRNYVSGYQNASVIFYDKGTMIFTESLLSGNDPSGEFVELSDERLQEYMSKLDGVSVSAETAEANAQQVMHDLHLPPMKPENYEKAILFSYEGAFGVDSMRLPIAGWWITFMRDYGEISCLSDMQIYLNQRNDEIADYSAPTSVEAVRIFYSDQGLERFYYDGVLDEIVDRAKDVSMLSFSSIQDIARKQLYYQQAFWNDNPDMKKEVVIDSMAMKLVYVREPNSENRLRLIPTWVLTGRCKYLLNGKELTEREEKISLVISAENGGVIKFGGIDT